MATKLGIRAAPDANRNVPLIPSGQFTDLLAKGRRHHQAGQLAEAETCYKTLLAIDPTNFDGLHLLGVLAQQVGRSDVAARLIGKAVASHDHSPAPHNSGALGRSRSTVSRRDLAVAHSNLCIALTALGDLPAALKAVQCSLRLAESANAKLLFVGCLRNLSVIPDGIDLRDDLARAMSEPWGRPTDLARVAANLVKQNAGVGSCIRRIAVTWPRLPAHNDLFAPDEFAQIYTDRLLCCLLKSTIVFDLELERFLTAIRRTMLAAAHASTSSQAFGRASLEFCCALAQQCFINEYVFSWTAEEKHQADRLRERLAEALAIGAPIPELWLAAIAAYYPLVSLSQSELLIKRHWSAFAAQLIKQQVQEVHEEQRLRDSIQRLTDVDDGISLTVKGQYEENPYPRWIKASPAGPTTIEAHLKQLFPLANLHNVVKTEGAEILIAGCGTGQHPIETARLFPGARILAIDLSISSLCYAKRKTRELGLKNLEYAQADILKLQSINRTFDIIEVGGVLHHLAQPMAGWHLLLSLLRPGGFMRIGLYSKLARQDVTAARTLIAQWGYGSSAEDIRRCRQQLLGLGGRGLLAKVADRIDFFSTSRCRDLLFHVQEHQLTLPEIDAFLRQNQLVLLGFDFHGSALQIFRQRFSDPDAAINLAHWHTFETENPSLFAGMYQFWVRKPG